MATTASTDRGSRLASLADDHLVATFYAVTLVVSWGLWLPAFLLVEQVSQLAVIPGAFGPALAAALLVRLQGGSVRAWFRDCLDWRTDARWYVTALGLPVLLGIAMGLLLAVLGDGLSTGRLRRTALTYPLVLAFTTLLGGGQEEFGWRGFALPALQRRFDALTASVLVGVGWAGWHFPLFAFDVAGYAALSFPLYALLVVGFSVLFTWLHNGSGGSILLAMVLHGGINAASGLGGAFVGADAAAEVPVLLAYVVPVWTVALVLVVRYGSATITDGSRVTGVATTDAV